MVPRLACIGFVVFLLQLHAAGPRGCVASVPLGTFHLAVQPPSGGSARALAEVNVIQAGHKLLYRPRTISGDVKKKARVALVLAPPPGSPEKIAVLEPHAAGQPAEWTAPFRVAVVGVVFGPQGLDRKKVSALVAKDQELVVQLADYAEQTAQVESLIAALAEADQGPSAGKNLDAALSGFARQYGMTVPKLDRTAPSDQQAMALLRALNPALGAYDPLAQQQAARMQQSAGLAASVAGLFFGSTVGLAAGSAAMAQNLRTLMFPDTDFRSALAQRAGSDSVTLCAKRQAQKSRTRIAYLWAHRVPNARAPEVSIAPDAHVPIGAASAVSAKASEWRYLDRARDWSLVSLKSASFPVVVKASPAAQALEIDLSNTTAPPGTYRLAAKWDWEAFETGGEITLHPLADLGAARLTPESEDALIEGSGVVKLKLTGADFEFLDAVALKSPGSKTVERPLEFTLPAGKAAGPQNTVEVSLDTGALKRGAYRLCLVQRGRTGEVPLRVLPPNPKLVNLPLQANIGEDGQKIMLRGSGLERIESIVSQSAEFELRPPLNDSTREATVRLAAGVKPGDRVQLDFRVQGLHAPLHAPSALEVIGPRPQIAAVKGSWPDDLGVALREGELPAGSFVSFSMRVDHLDTQPAVRLQCQDPEKNLRSGLLRPGEKSSAARLELAGAGTLFVSFDPGAVGQAGCSLSGVVITATGVSEPYALGRVVRLPRIESFTLTSEKMGESGYAGILTGRDLETIEKAGWDADSGVPVDTLPKPVAGEGQKQSLKIALVWPSPVPHAPVYIWLRGEREGRATTAHY